jgi:general secretion pathway protein L
MLMRLPSGNGVRWRGALEEWVKWWVGELTAMLPASVKTWLEQARATTLIEISPEDVVVASQVNALSQTLVRMPSAEFENADAARIRATEIAGSLASRGDVILSLPGHESLVQKVTFPLAAARNLKSIVKFEAERRCPVSPNLMMFDHRVIRRDRAANRLEVEIRIVNKASVDKALKLARSLGLGPSAIGFRDGAGRVSDWLMVIPSGSRFRQFLRRHRMRALLVLTIALAVAFILTGYVRDLMTAGDLERQVAQAKIGANEVTKLEGDLKAAVARVTFLTEKKAAPSLLTILAEVTRRLPDDTWVYNLELKGDSVRVQGFSQAAPALIGVLDRSTLFRNAQFRAPLTPGQSNGSVRFDLTASVEGASP